MLSPIRPSSRSSPPKVGLQTILDLELCWDEQSSPFLRHPSASAFLIFLSLPHSKRSYYIRHYDSYKIGGFRIWRPQWVGGGGPQKAEKRNEVAWIMYVTRGGVKKSENFADVRYESPLCTMMMRQMTMLWGIVLFWRFVLRFLFWRFVLDLPIYQPEEILCSLRSTSIFPHFLSHGDKEAGIFSLKHESKIIRSFNQPCMWFWKCQASPS